MEYVVTSNRLWTHHRETIDDRLRVLSDRIDRLHADVLALLDKR
jgi:hypothetical protein